MATMTSRERVLTALAHEEPDRVPIILGVNMNTALVEGAQERLKRMLGIESPIEYLYMKTQQTVRMDEALMRRLGSDAYGIQDLRPYAFRDEAIPDEPGARFYDEWQMLYEKEETGGFRKLKRPLDGEVTIADIEKLQWPDMADPARIEGIRARAQSLAAEGEYSIWGAPLRLYPYEMACHLREMTYVLMDMVSDQDFIRALYAKLTSLFKVLLDQYLGAVGEYLDVICIGDDLGTQAGLLFSPETYRTVLKPFHADLISFIRQRTKAYVYFHSDGDVERLIGDLIEIGVDILNPVQTDVGGMADLAALKRKYGDHLSFCGAIDTHRILPFGTPEEVRAEVRRVISLLGPRGGYLLSSVHAIQDDVPPENILAMCDAAREFGQYPLG
jgi:uroporphyrinogen decarboxylase